MDTVIPNGKEFVKGVIELSDTTFQGEGQSLGRLVTILRFKACNLNCTFKIGNDIDVCACDTQEKMKLPDLQCTFEDIKEKVKDSGNLMITGGEPSLYIEEIVKVLRYLISEKVDIYSVDIESNGFKLDELLSRIEMEGFEEHFIFNVMWSPKMYNEKIFNDNVEKMPKILKNGNVYLKVVAAEENRVEEFLNKVSKSILVRKTFIMPVGSNMEDQRKYFDTAMRLAKKFHCRISPRAHLFYNVA